MITTRKSPAAKKNTKIVARHLAPNVGNRGWLSSRARPGALILLGGSDVAHFRVRVAQSHLRHDLLPSFWSLVGVIDSAETFLSAPLEIGPDVAAVPSHNAIRSCTFQEFDDPARYPNVAVVHFAEDGRTIVENVEKLRIQRSAVDLPTMVLAWLGFVWGAGARHNPLLESVGLPSAALVETAFGMASIELTPGLASASSCPEAIWQAASWWHEYYAKTAEATPARRKTRRETPAGPRAVVPFGEYVIRQEAAAVVEISRAEARRV